MHYLSKRLTQASASALKLLLMSLLMLVVLNSYGQLALPPNLIALNSPEGQALLINSDHRTDYWSLSDSFVTQDNRMFCGIASSVMALNALQVTAPPDPLISPYRIFTQHNIFSSKTESVIPRKKILKSGMTLGELGQFLQTFPVIVTTHYAKDVNENEFRQLAITAVSSGDQIILVNYERRAVNQLKGGHISPLAAYNAQADRFLVLDVARFKYPPVWITTKQLWQAMNTVDSASGLTRGFVVIKKVS